MEKYIMKELIDHFIETNLSDLQKTRFEGISWMLSGSRASGRTFVLALAFIKKSLVERSRVMVFDHEYHPNGKRIILDQIVKIVDRIKPLKLKIYGQSMGSNRAYIEVSLKNEKYTMEDFLHDSSRG
jgi:hypothetical protein